MLIYDVLHKEKVYRSVANDLRNLGVKHRLKKNATKSEKIERSRGGGAGSRKVFKVSLSRQPLDVVNLSSGATVQVPAFVSQAATYLEKFFNHEGLFRKAGSLVRQKELIGRLDAGATLGDKNHHAIDVANCLKTFFRDLPEPLIPYVYHDLFVRCLVLRSRRVEALLLACILLPPHHLNTLAFFMGFLKKVSFHESQNKMSVDNLATVIGPNIMPLQDTTMSAVQSRLDAHLVIVKILIENAKDIGVLPEHISEAVATPVSGGVEPEFNSSNSISRTRNKKKKHRSGSLTRMFNGLRKMVGKSGSPGEAEQPNDQLVLAQLDPMHTPSIIIGKKRKVVEPVGPVSAKKKRDILDAMPKRTNHHSQPLLASPVCSNPNPVRRETSPINGSKVRKYLTQKVHSEMRVFEKVEKPKKLRLSLDRFVSRSKQKVANNETTESRKVEPYSPCIERRWSSASGASTREKNKNEEEESEIDEEPLMRKETTSLVSDDYDRIFMDADVNLSDDCNERMNQRRIRSTPENNNNINHRRRRGSGGDGGSNSRRSLDATILAETTRERTDHSTNEEYVRIPKSEYEEIKSRVSAIESRISQEFGSIANETDDIRTKISASNVQSEYEKTLGEASIESTITADNLAKRLGKELKIRRSSEHKIIRSPSARKIGILRRRSQEKVSSRRVSRNASWHMRTNSQRSGGGNDEKNKNNSIDRSNSVIYKTPNKSARNNDYYHHNDGAQHVGGSVDSLCSDETNARLNYLQEQLHTLITHTAEHTRGSFSDDEAEPVDDDNTVAKNVRRASSFHGNELIDNSRYFNNRVKELKKSNSQQNVYLIGKTNLRLNETSSKPVGKSITTVSWKDAAGYFKSDIPANLNTPVQQTGRASVAKLRTQNAGMVLAKAKLFDENETRIEMIKQTSKMPRLRESKNLENEVSRRDGSSTRKKPSPKRKNNARMRSSSASSSPVTNCSSLIKMELTILPSHDNNSRQTEKRPSRRGSHKFEQRENHEISRANGKDGDNREQLFKSSVNQSFPIGTILQDSNVNCCNPDSSLTCKTPHIKRSLATKTPKSARSLARRPIVAARSTPLKAVPTLGATPKRQSPRNVLKSRQLSRPIN